MPFHFSIVFSRAYIIKRCEIHNKNKQKATEVALVVTGQVTRNKGEKRLFSN